MKQKNTDIQTILLFIIYLLLLIGVVLFKLPFYSETLTDTRVINVIPFQGSFDENGGLLFSEIVYNIFLFVPLGVYLGLLKQNWSFRKKATVIICLSLALEAIQFIFAIGRSDVTDILNNTLGGVIGIAFFAFLGIVFKSRALKITRLIAMAATICVVICFGCLFFLSHGIMKPPTA